MGLLRVGPKRPHGDLEIGADGGEAIQVTRNGGDGPVYFADGFMYYRKGHPVATIFRAAVDGGAEEQVFERRVWWSSWVASERGLYFLTVRRAEAVLALFDFADRAVKELAVVGQLDQMAPWKHLPSLPMSRQCFINAARGSILT